MIFNIKTGVLGFLGVRTSESL